MPQRACSLAWIASLVLLCSASAQATLTVGPTGYPDVQAAISAAAPGDRILIQAGMYPSFVADRSLTVRADPTGAAVRIVDTVSTRFVLGPDHRVHVQGIAFESGVQVAPSTRGVATFEGCGFFDLLAVRSDTAFQSCQMNGGRRPGLLVENAAVSLSQCTVNGGASLGPLPGIIARQGAHLQVSGCMVRGGIFQFGTHTLPQPGVGMFVDSNAAVWITDSSVGVPTLMPPDPAVRAIDNRSSVPVTLTRSTFPSSHPTPIDGPSVLAQHPQIASRGGPITTGSPWTLDVRGQSGAFVILHGSLDIGDARPHPLLIHREWGFARSSEVFAVMALPATGQSQVTLSIPNLPALRDASFWTAAWAGPTLPAPLTALVGGVIR